MDRLDTAVNLYSAFYKDLSCYFVLDIRRILMLRDIQTPLKLAEKVIFHSESNIDMI